MTGVSVMRRAVEDIRPGLAIVSNLSMVDSPVLGWIVLSTLNGILLCADVPLRNYSLTLPYLSRSSRGLSWLVLSGGIVGYHSQYMVDCTPIEFIALSGTI